jgi:hypothetical protein
VTDPADSVLEWAPKSAHSTGMNVPAHANFIVCAESGGEWQVAHATLSLVLIPRGLSFLEAIRLVTPWS